MQIYIYILFARFSAKGFSILSNTPFADLTASVMPPLSNPFSIDPHHTKPREYGDFFHRILPYSRSPYNKYGTIIQKIYRNCIQPYSVRIQENTVPKGPIFTVVSCSALHKVFQYSLHKDSVNTGEYGAKKPRIHGGFV